jgi:ribonuclease HI
MSESINFHVSKPKEKQFHPINTYIKVTNKKINISYTKKGEEYSIDIESKVDYERNCLIAIIKTIETIGETKRPIIIHTDNPYTKTCIKEWIEKWSKTEFENKPNADILKQIWELKQKIIFDVVLKHKM